MMRTRLILSVVALAAATVFATDAQAQRPGGGRGGFGGGFGGPGGGASSPLMLVNLEPVQKELGLKEDQVSKLKTIAEQAREARQAAGGNPQDFRQLPEEERRKKFAEMAEAGRKLNEKFKPKVAEILDAQQNERLQQIVWQSSGAQAYQDPEVIKALSLTKEQQDKLAAVTKEFADKQGELFAGVGGGGSDIQERFAKVRELNEARDKKLADVLSQDQRDQFAKLKGKPFDLAQLRGGFGGGQPSGGRPNATGRPRRPQSDEKKSDEKQSEDKK